MTAELELLDKAVRLCATGLISVVATAGLNYVRSMAQSITELNLSVARLLERSVLLEKAIDLLSARIGIIEQKGE